CELPQYAIYTHTKDGKAVDLPHKYAICILIDQEYDTFHGATGNDWISNSQSFRSYSASGFIACIIANYIRRLGYHARAHHARNYQVALPPILLLAGMGEMCRIGDIVLNPFLGPRFKAAVVTTDLPLLPDKPIDFGLQQFCKYCRKCARECPAKAITDGEKSFYNGYEVWKPDVERCTKFRCTNQNGSGCGHCIKVCPWNKPRKWYHDTVRWTLERSDIARRIMVRLDDMLGYGKQDIHDKWWFDLEEVDGILKTPCDKNQD
ncbi:MAG: reductive dehalogenase, partial [Chloroflexi bacterium]|nr:reductive dehalogenase [Chloroflexota bacterium]